MHGKNFKYTFSHDLFFYSTKVAHLFKCITLIDDAIYESSIAINIGYHELIKASCM